MNERRIPILHSQRELTLDELVRLPLNPFGADWYGQPPVAETSFSLALDPRALSFCVRCLQPPDFDAAAREGAFTEGLWQRDVAEFFLCEDGTSRYQEFNLSPSGAWWSCLFDDYRKPSGEKVAPPRHVQCKGRVEPGSWVTALSIPRDWLAVTIAFNAESRANVCAIINGRARQFLSFAKLSSKEPDFHRAAEFPHIAPELSA